MATSKCFAAVRGRVLRTIRLDGCGSPVLGPDSVVVTEGFVTIGFTSNILTGEVIEVTNAGGKICVSDKPVPKFVNYTIVITLCGVEPDLINIFTGNPLVFDDNTDAAAIGFDVESDVDLDGQAFSLELWTGVPTDACEDGVEQQWGYTVVPFIKGGVLGDFSIENAALNFQISGAESKDGSQWGVGPFPVLKDKTGVPSVLFTPLSNRNHQRMIVTSLAPPVAACGTSALGVPATTANAVGTLIPANSYAPKNLAAVGSLLASPTTAWTAGQHVTFRDGTYGHWNGTAWVAGIA